MDTNEVEGYTVRKVIETIGSGIYEGGNVMANVKLIRRSSRIQKLLKEILPLYSIFAIVNVYLFILGLWFRWTDFVLYCLTWFIPAWCVCNVITYKWYINMWNLVYSKKEAKPTSLNLLDNLAHIIHGNLLFTVYVIQISIGDWILTNLFSSYIGVLYSVVNISWLISWNAFEFKMMHEGLDLFQRVYYFERRWLYFLGYGLPLSLVYTFVPWQLGVCVWYFGIMIMSLRAILSNPVKWEGDQDDYLTRLKIFWIPKHITCYILGKFMEMTKYKPLRKVKTN